MVTPATIPPELGTGPFTTRRAANLGISKDTLSGRRFRRLFRGVYVLADQAQTPELLVRAALLVLPPDSAVSHLTALHSYGVTVGRDTRLHFSTNTSSQTSLPGVVLHRRERPLVPQLVRGVPTLGTERTFVDCATRLGHVDLIRAGDWLVRLGLTTPDRLLIYSITEHISGVQRARRVSPYVRARVESVMETDVRLLLQFARLPTPELNANLSDSDGDFLARGDLVYREYWVIVEYDGWQHERDAQQRQRDHLRRERLESNGWRVIVVTIEDMRSPSTVVVRVHRALVQSGYHGPAPVMSESWRRWFTAA